MTNVSRQLVDLGSHALSVLQSGHGRPLLMVPSLGRGAADFLPLAGCLDPGQFRCIMVNLRGIDGSGGALDGLSLHDLAGDLAGLMKQLGLETVDTVGHAFGNRVVRCLAADHPQAVSSCALLGAGGLVEADAERQADFIRALKGELSGDAFHQAIRRAHFAPGADGRLWREGWWIEAARGQAKAARDTDRGDWWSAGDARLLVIQGADDCMAPPENGAELQKAFAGRVTLHTVEDAGHALLVEQPRVIGGLISDYYSGG